MAKKIVAAGMVCLDITPVFPQTHHGAADALFAPGKLIEMEGVQTHVGGSIANTGLAFRRFGAEAMLMGKVGQDPFGSLVLAALAEHGVAEHLKISQQDVTSYSVVLAPPGVDRMFLHYPGANDTFCLEDLDLSRIKGADLFHFGYPTVMRRMYQQEGAELLRLFRAVKGTGVLTSLDMAAVDAASEAAKVDWAGVLRGLMPFVDFFVPSVEELCFLVDRQRHAQWMLRARGRDITELLSIQEDIRPLADTLLDWGAKVVLIKCGAPGMYLRTADKETLGRMGNGLEQWADLEMFEPGYVADRYCSGTGAGDVSIAAFLTAALEGYTPRESLRLATGAGACCVSAYDALSGLLSFEEMRQKMEAGWAKR